MKPNYPIETWDNKDWSINWLMKKEVDQCSQDIILEVLEALAEFCPLAREKLPRGKIKFLFDGIFEIRVGQYRIAYFWNNSTCYLLYGFQKKRNDWPKRYIKTLKKRKNYFYSIKKHIYLK